MNNEKLLALKKTEISILNSIIKLLETFDVGSLRLLKDNNEFLIKVNGETVLETDNGLVKQHFTKLNIKVTERIALSRISDTLQFTLSEIYNLEDTMFKEAQNIVDEV